MYILPFEQCSKEEHNRVGGKCASLGAMIQAEAPVPPGFAVTTEAFAEMLRNRKLRELVKSEIASVADSDDPDLQEVSRKVRAAIEAEPVAEAIETAVRNAYAKLSADCGSDAIPVAVRSSATAEDLPDASFAGQQDTYLWIVGADAVVEHVRKCWSSMFTARAIAYRLDKGFSHEEVTMAVAVQKMVNAKAAGVAFTLNPINGDRSKIAVDSSWGLGESVVSGEVTPDNFLVDKVILDVVKETISPKHIEYAVDLELGRAIKREVEPERQTQPSITRDELIAVAKMAKRAEKFYKHPQDVEWAIDADLPAPDNVVVLQSRPETVWSRKKQKSVVTGGMFGMTGMVNTLIKGVKTGVKK
ncbi:MAG: PEP/pyruvate-binding domain-containing protein [Chloroflexota bacterium]